VGTGNTVVGTKALPAGTPYLVFAFTHVFISGAAGQKVQVDCTLSANGATNSNTLIVEIGPGAIPQQGTVPLLVTAAAPGLGASAAVTCKRTATPATPAPTVLATTPISAIQTAGNS
jgi:hypothetical protein